MWTSFSHENQIFLIKFSYDNDILTVEFTDLHNIWLDKISSINILQRFSEFNPSIDVKEDFAVSKILELLNNVNKTSTNIEISPLLENVELCLRSKLSEFNICFKLCFKKQETNLIASDVIAPLIHTVKYLETQQKSLCDLLQKKDRELEEFKLEKGDISRTDLVTNKFDREIIHQLNSNETLVLNAFNADIFWKKFVEKYGDLQTEVLRVTKEPWNQVKKKRKIYSSKTAKKCGLHFQSEEIKKEDL